MTTVPYVNVDKFGTVVVVSSTGILAMTTVTYICECCYVWYTEVIASDMEMEMRNFSTSPQFTFSLYFGIRPRQAGKQTHLSFES